VKPLSGLTQKHETKLEKPARNKHSSLLGPFVSNDENIVVKYCPRHLKITSFRHNSKLLKIT